VLCVYIFQFVIYNAVNLWLVRVWVLATVAYSTISFTALTLLEEN